MCKKLRRIVVSFNVEIQNKKLNYQKKKKNAFHSVEWNTHEGLLLFYYYRHN